MPAALSTIDVAVPPDRFMALLTDFASYPTFLPEMAGVELLRSRPAEWEVRFTLRLIRPLVYTLRLTQPDEHTLRWTLVEGAFHSNDGGWKLEPIEGGRCTRATYAIDLQVGMYVPGNIVRSLVDRSLPDTLERFKAEAERRVLS